MQSRAQVSHASCTRFVMSAQGAAAGGDAAGVAASPARGPAAQHPAAVRRSAHPLPGALRLHQSCLHSMPIGTACCSADSVLAWLEAAACCDIASRNVLKLISTCAFMCVICAG